MCCRPFIAAFIAFAIAQLLKVFTFWYSERRWDYTRVVGSGGMPSSHTACVSCLGPIPMQATIDSMTCHWSVVCLPQWVLLNHY